MFTPAVIHQLRDSRPFLPILSDQCHQDVVFFFRPSLLFYFRRQVAIPSLSASRRVNEQTPITGEVHVHADTLPIFLSLLFNQLQQLCVIVLSPIVAFLVFDDTQTLMFQKERILIEETFGDGPPLSFALHRPIITISAGVKLLIMQ